MIFEKMNKLKDIFRDTYLRYTTDETLMSASEKSAESTLFYPMDELPTITAKNKKGKIELSKEKTFESVINIRKTDSKSKIAVLNFASAVHPGGGVKRGCTAQEECLCRCSTLLPAIDQRHLRDIYYAPNIERNDRRNTDACIYSPDIIIFKTDDEYPVLMEEKDWCITDVITCAAPDLREISISMEEMYNLHVSRAKHILSVAADNDVDILILGAFGCGAFRNDPHIVAKAYRSVLSEHLNDFDLVKFAIFCENYETENYKAFKEEFYDLIQS